MIQVTFNQQGDFEAVNAAREWCRERGISVGSMCGNMPMGLLYGDFCIAKWRNLTRKERAQCHGTITGEMRYGPVTINVKESQEPGT